MFQVGACQPVWFTNKKYIYMYIYNIILDCYRVWCYWPNANRSSKFKHLWVHEDQFLMGDHSHNNLPPCTLSLNTYRYLQLNPLLSTYIDIVIYNSTFIHIALPKKVGKYTDIVGLSWIGLPLWHLRFSQIIFWPQIHMIEMILYSIVCS